jgi:hypothetical protein
MNGIAAPMILTVSKGGSATDPIPVETAAINKTISIPTAILGHGYANLRSGGGPEISLYLSMGYFNGIS